MSSLDVCRAVLARDLKIELRSREGLQAMLFYALLVVVIFSFAFSSESDLTGRVGGALLWVAFLFAGIVALDRAFLREEVDECMLGMQIAPCSRSALLAGKFLASFLTMAAIEAVLLPIFAILFNTPAQARWGGILLTTVLGTWALAANGTYFSAMSMQAKQRGILLPLLLLPISIPAVIAMVQATQVYLGAAGVANYWLKLLLGYDIIFTALGLLLADTVLDVE